MRVWAFVLVVILLVAGCAKPKEATGPKTTRIEVLVVDQASKPLAGHVQLNAGAQAFQADTGKDGLAGFDIEPSPTCTITASAAGFAIGVHAVDCSKGTRFTVKLRPAPPGGATGTPSPTGTPSLDPETGNETFVVSGVVASASGPLAGATVLATGPVERSTRTNAAGAYGLELPAGDYTLVARAPCHADVTAPLAVAGPAALDLRLEAAVRALPAPTNVRAVPGPGAGMATVAWDAVEGATGYTLLRGGAPLVQTGNSLAYGVHEVAAGDAFSVQARDACAASPASAEVAATPLPGAPPSLAGSIGVGADVQEESFGVLDAAGAAAAEAPWRIVQGTGNCCENYIATTPAGRILDQGGSTIAYSDDEGRTWSGVLSQAVLLAGEGSVAAAPDGDIVAFDWATYNADTAFAYKWSAATGKWYSAPVPMKTPVFDRPWISTVKGPFTVGDVVAPYACVVEGGTALKVRLVSLDCLVYVQQTPLTATVGSRADLALSSDLDRDFTAPLAEFDVVPMDRGFGLVGTTHAILQDALTPVQLDLGVLIPHPIVRGDALGRLHSVASEGDAFAYAISHDGGHTWQDQRFPLPDGLAMGEEWDFRVDSRNDQAVFAVNANSGGGKVQQVALRLKGLDATPRLVETLKVGRGDGLFGSGILANGNRFDFMTLGFLPDGRIVMSGADARDAAPFMAIELPREATASAA